MAMSAVKRAVLIPGPAIKRVNQVAGSRRNAFVR